MRPCASVSATMANWSSACFCASNCCSALFRTPSSARDITLPAISSSDAVRANMNRQFIDQQVYFAIHTTHHGIGHFGQSRAIALIEVFNAPNDDWDLSPRLHQAEPLKEFKSV